MLARRSCLLRRGGADTIRAVAPDDLFEVAAAVAMHGYLRMRPLGLE
ncbi:hypothetical protein [Micromonospora pisi]|nr:hypothetical protein [Micromonospora pisi]